MDVPKVSIIIPTKNNADTIAQCLDSILSLDYPKDRFLVYVIDAFSKDGTQEILREYQKNSEIPIHVIEADLNAPQAYNFILKEISDGIVGFLDGDATVDKNWLKILVPYLELPQVGGAGGIVLTRNPDKRFARCVGYELQDRFERMPGYCTRLPTCNLIVTRDVLSFKLDENLYTGYDADLCYSLVKSGLKIVYVPEAKVYHSHRETPKKFFKQQFNYGFNAVRLYLKHSSFLFGDTKTYTRMFFQPPLLLLSILCSLLGLLWFPAFFFSFFIILSLLILYAISAIYLAKKYNDLSSVPCLILVFIVRLFAWTLGGVYGMVKTLPVKLKSKR